MPPSNAAICRWEESLQTHTVWQYRPSFKKLTERCFQCNFFKCLLWYICDTNFPLFCLFEVDPGPYFDSCVRDSCACDAGGDCECFCTAVAAYAKACNEAGVCVKWRTPHLCRKSGCHSTKFISNLQDFRTEVSHVESKSVTHESESDCWCESHAFGFHICNKGKTADLLFVIAVFCDYYNTPGDCEWHYKSCGADCMKTCRNPSGNCSKQITALEGKVESSFFVMLHLNLFFSVWGWSNLTLTLMYFNSVLRCTTKDFCCNLLYVFWQQITCLALKNIFDYSVPL